MPIALQEAPDVRSFSFEQALDRHPEIDRTRLRVRDLSERFETGGSVAALLRRMGPFKPDTDAFQFSNDFEITFEQAGDFLDMLTDEIVEGVVQAVVATYVHALRGIDLNPIPKLETRIPDFVIDIVDGSVSAELTARIIDLLANPVGNPLGSDYGRCGGMAFAGYDFYLAGRPIDATVTDPPAEGPLGDYIYERLLDSLRLNIGTFLKWYVDLNLLASLDEFATTALGHAVGGPVGALIGAYIGGKADIFDLGPGPKVLLDPTKREWTRIKRILDEQAAWPVGLIKENDSLWEQHQVLAIGYKDIGPEQGVLIIWDNEDGPRKSTMNLDFRGEELEVSNRPDVKGFFHERYTPQQPPDGL
jgi:hypothetical protein